MSDAKILSLAKLLNGPYNQHVGIDRDKLKNLRDVRWGFLNEQDRGLFLGMARVVLKNFNIEPRGDSDDPCFDEWECEDSKNEL